MDFYSPKCFGHEDYSKKLRTEVNAIMLLTETVLSEIDKKGMGNKAVNNILKRNKDLVFGSPTWADKLELYSR